MTSLPLLPPAYCPDDSLPDYRQSLQLNRSPAYASLTLIPTQGSTSTQAISISSGFFFESKRLTLDLGPRQWSPQLPVYGRNGLIEGHVGIKSFNRVDRVEVGLTGTVLFYTLSNGTPSLRTSQTVLFEKSTIWSSDKQAPESEGTFPFTLTLPDHASGPEFEYVVTPLPPSASITTKTSSVYVFYCLRVDMFRQNVYSHDSVQTEILYLPRTVSRYERPFIPLPGSEKPRRICDSEWHTAEVPRKVNSCTPKMASSLYGLSDVNVHLSLPHKLRFHSGCDVPFAVTLSGSGLSCANISQLIAGLKLTLVKTSTTIIKDAVSQEESVVSTGRICRVEENERHWRDSKPGNNTPHAVVRGCIEAGTEGKDVSWGIRGHAGILYQVRLSLAPSFGQEDEPAAGMWEHKETVVITSHEWEGQAATSLPALSLEAASRSPISISLLSGTKDLVSKVL